MQISHRQTGLVVTMDVFMFRIKNESERIKNGCVHVYFYCSRYIIYEMVNHWFCQI